MGGIHIVSKTNGTETTNSNTFPIYRGTVLGNPYTQIKDKKTKAKYIVETKEDAVKAYGSYFDIMYGSNAEFTRAIDLIYEKFKNGDDVDLVCYCKDIEHCHGQVIKNKLSQRLIKEKLLKK